MSDVFYVRTNPGVYPPSDAKAGQPKQWKYVAATYLRDGDGNYVINPNPPKENSNYSNYFYNIDGSRSLDINPRNYVVAPIGYNIDYSKSVGEHLKDNVDELNTSQNPDIGPGEGDIYRLIYLKTTMSRGGSQDLQRNYILSDGTIVFNGDPVPAFQDVASIHFGIVTHSADIDERSAKYNAGTYNKSTAGTDTSGTLGLNPRDDKDIDLGINLSNSMPVPDGSSSFATVLKAYSPTGQFGQAAARAC